MSQEFSPNKMGPVAKSSVSSLSDLRMVQIASFSLAKGIPFEQQLLIRARYDRALQRAIALIEGRREPFYTP